MNGRMMVLAGLALIGVTHGVILAGVAYNRSGADSQLRLSEREVRRGYDWAREENSALSLRLDWRVPRAGEDLLQPALLDAATLQSLGLTAAPGQRRRHAAWVVLELDGAAYQQDLARARQRADDAAQRQAHAPQDAELKTLLERAEAQLTEVSKRQSRLYAVAVGPDAEALRTRYPDRSRYALFACVVAAWSDRGALVGRIEQIPADQLHVPRRFRASLLQATQPSATPLTLDLAVGRRLQPWIEAVTPGR